MPSLAAAPQPAPRNGDAVSSARSQSAARPAVDAPLPQASAPLQPQLRIDSFPALVALAGEKREVQIKAALESDVRLVHFEDGKIELSLERSASRSLIGDLSRKLEQWTGRRWTVVVSNAEGAPTLRAQAKSVQNERERTAESDPRVREVMARWPGTKIEAVRRLTPDASTDDAGEEVAPIDDSDDD